MIILGFYAGFLSLLLREIPFSSIQFPIYEFMKKRTLEKHKTIGFWQSGWNGLVAAVIGYIDKYNNLLNILYSCLFNQSYRCSEIPINDSKRQILFEYI